MAVRFLSSENIDGVLTFSTTGTFGNNASITHYTNNYLYIRGGSAGLVVGDNTSATRAEFSSSNFITWEINSVAAMHINSSRNVGIGTTSPSGNLHVVGASGSAGRIYISDADQGTGASQSFLLMKSGNSSFIYNREAGRLALGSGGTNDHLNINSSGNVGIGTTSPARKLDISAGGNDGIRIASANAFIGGGASGGDTQLIYWNGSNVYYGRSSLGGSVSQHEFRTGGTTRLTIDSAGNVGIGTTSPDFNLHIVNSTTNGGLLLEHSSQASGFQIAQNIRQTEGLIWQKWTNGSFTSNLMTLDYDGNLGIGTTSPSTKLEIQVSTNQNILRGHFGQSADIFLGFDQTNPRLILQDNSNVTTHLFQANASNYIVNSNVGIGVTNPSFKTHFRGGSNTEETVLKIDKSSYADTGGHTTILGFGNEPAGWAKGGIGYERTGSYDRGKIHFLQENTGNTDTVTLADSVMTIQPDGNVGIAETNPTSFSSGATTLHIKGTVTSKAGAIHLRSSDNSIDAFVYPDSTNGMSTGTLSNHSYRILTNSAERMRIDSSGNVGINETSPASSRFTDSNSRILDISGNAVNRGGVITLRTSDNSKEAFLANDGGNLQIGMYTNNGVTFYTNNTERMRITSGGYILTGGRTSVTGNWGVGSIEAERAVGAFNSNKTIYLFNNGTTLKLDAYDYGASSPLNITIGGNGGDIILSGDVGIGTTSPSAKLHVSGTGNQGVQAWFGNGFVNNSLYHYDFARVGFSVEDQDGADTGAGFHFNTRNSADTNWLHGYIYQPQNGGIAFGTGGAGTTVATEKMRITSAGEVVVNDGINYGANPPTHRGSIILAGASAPTNFGGIEFHTNSGGGAGYGTKIYSSDATWGIATRNNSTTFTTRFEISGSTGNAYFTGNLGIGVTSPPDKLYVDAGTASIYAGHFVYGGTDGAKGCLKLRTVASTGPSFIDFFYDGFSTNPLSPVGAIVTTGSATLYSSYSDYRLKENIADLTGALDRVNNLQPKTFNYINVPEITNEGFLAHELQEIVPQAVSGTKDGVDENGNPKYQGVDNAHIVPLLVGAIKELKAEIENLKSQIQ